jgi:hypothetical protein
MSDLEKLQDKAVAPVPSMLAKPKPLNIVYLDRVKEFQDTSFHHVQKAKIVNHRGELKVV